MMDGVKGLVVSGPGSDDNRVTDNFITGMSSEAIWLNQASSNRIEGNYLIDNQIGVAITSGSENLLSSNRIIDHTNGVLIAATPLASEGASGNRIIHNKLYGNQSAIDLTTFGSSLDNLNNWIEGNAIRDGHRGLSIGDPGNVKTTIVENWFDFNSSVHIEDLGTSSLFSGNVCDGLSCP